MLYSENYLIRKRNNFSTNTENISCIMQTEPRLHGFKESRVVTEYRSTAQTSFERQWRRTSFDINCSII